MWGCCLHNLSVFITQPLERDPVSNDITQFSHVAYGMGIQSNIHIPELAVANLAPELVIQYDATADLWAHLPVEILSKQVALQITAEAAIIYIKNTGLFQLDAGHKVTVIPAPTATLAQVRHALCGIVMAVVLHQRGQFVLHGSAVTITGTSIAFLGQSGEGKSSMAAALYAQGHDLLSDDLLAVNLAVTPPTLTAAGTPIKLYPEIAKRVGITTPGQPVPTPRPKQLYTWAFPSAHAAIVRCSVCVVFRHALPDRAFVSPSCGGGVDAPRWDAVVAACNRCLYLCAQHTTGNRLPSLSTAAPSGFTTAAPGGCPGDCTCSGFGRRTLR